MREIKFGAWDKKYNCMCSSYDLWINGDGGLFEQPGRTYNTPNQEIERIPNDAYILMQYINRKDIKNQEICTGHIIEANIIEFSVPTMGEVVYDQSLSMYASKNQAGLTPLYKLDRIKIIGNKLENPELLK